MKRNSTRIKKEPIDPARLRTVPREGFSWIDRRFVREGFIDRLPGEAILLYFFLVAVSDAHGLSFYSDPTMGRLLKLGPEEITQARAHLIRTELVLYRYPIHQVLRLPSKPPPPRPQHRARRSPGGDDPLSIGEILGNALKKLHG